MIWSYKNYHTLNKEKVKSYGECLIANFLCRNGIAYQYEREYNAEKKKLEKSPGRLYKPDFYIPSIDTYIEYFGIERDDNTGQPTTAKHIDTITYIESMNWKKDLHLTNNTNLISLYEHQKQRGKLLHELKKQLKKKIPNLRPISTEELIKKIRNCKKTDKFIKLVKDFSDKFQENPDITIKNLKKDKSAQCGRTQRFLDLFGEIYKRYNEELVKLKKIDYGSMISESIHLVRANQYKHKWRYIIIDEFQDISKGRMALIKSLLVQNRETKLFCVGDDWQAIYRFAGSDHHIMRNFPKYVPERTIGMSKLDQTFRFNNKIAEVSEKFIMQNKSQIPKNIQTNIKKSEPQVFLHWIPNTKQLICRVEYVTKFIIHNYKGKLNSLSLQLLCRYKKTKNNAIEELEGNIQSIKNIWKDNGGKFLGITTIHKAKGLEADFVILVDLHSDNIGFPSSSKEDPILSLILPRFDKYPHGEERRLFYVAITRAKEQVHLIADPLYVSKFADELSNKKKWI